MPSRWALFGGLRAPTASARTLSQGMKIVSGLVRAASAAKACLGVFGQGARHSAPARLPAELTMRTPWRSWISSRRRIDCRLSAYRRSDVERHVEHPDAVIVAGFHYRRLQFLKEGLEAAGAVKVQEPSARHQRNIHQVAAIGFHRRGPRHWRRGRRSELPQPRCHDFGRNRFRRGSRNDPAANPKTRRRCRCRSHRPLDRWPRRPAPAPRTARGTRRSRRLKPAALLEADASDKRVLGEGCQKPAHAVRRSHLLARSLARG